MEFPVQIPEEADYIPINAVGGVVLPSIGNMQRSMLQGLVPLEAAQAIMAEPTIPPLASIPENTAILLEKEAYGVTQKAKETPLIGGIFPPAKPTSFLGLPHLTHPLPPPQPLPPAFCPENHSYNPVPAFHHPLSGYICSHHYHLITTSLLQEGKSGFFYLPDPSDITYQAGPYYPAQNSNLHHGTWLYHGVRPKVPPHAPEWIQGGKKGCFDAEGRKVPIMIGRDVVRRMKDRDLRDVVRVMGGNGGGKCDLKEVRKVLKRFLGLGYVGTPKGHGGKEGSDDQRLKELFEEVRQLSLRYVLGSGVRAD